MSRIALLASSATLALFASPALAQQTTDETDFSIEEAETPQEQIVVIGTRRTDRSAADSPVPIDVIGGDALNNSGYTEVNKVLNQLVPSFNFPQPSITDGTDALRASGVVPRSTPSSGMIVSRKM